MKKTTLQQLKLIANARKNKIKAGRKRLMTEEQMNLVRQMRSSGYNFAQIFESMQAMKMMPHKKYGCFLQAYKNR